MKILLSTALFALSLPASVLADDIFTDDISAQGGVCIGDDCADNEVFDLTDFDSHLRLKGSWTKIEFSDISGSSNPDRDWALRANEKGGGPAGEAFFIEDVTADTTPFYVEGGAPSNALFVADNGRIGLGTSLPGTMLHLAKETSPRIRLESTSAFFPQKWDVIGGNAAIAFRNISTNETPFAVDVGAPNYALWVSGTGNVGVGTLTASAPLELYRTDAFNFFRITAAGAAVNESVDITFTGGPLGTGQLRYNIVDGDNQEMSLDADGNMVLDGTLTTAGPTCAGGCDRVFDADYALASIEDHAKEMFSAGHLPAVGPTQPDVPLNVTEKMANMLNELEHAHIYIAQQQQDILQLKGEKHDLSNRLSQIETALAALQAKP